MCVSHGNLSSSIIYRKEAGEICFSNCVQCVWRSCSFKRHRFDLDPGAAVKSCGGDDFAVLYISSTCVMSYISYTNRLESQSDMNE